MENQKEKALAMIRLIELLGRQRTNPEGVTFL